METARASVPPNLGSVARTFTKILRLRRKATSSGSVAGVTHDEDVDSVHKLKLSQNLSGYFSAVLSEPPGQEFCKVELEQDKQQQQQQWRSSSNDREVMESLVANLFASVSAIKASYAELQIAQAPYDAESIQGADLAIVSELKRISELKQSYRKKQYQPSSQPALASQIQEQRSLIKTYQITSNKLEAELKLKEADVLALQTELVESERKKRALEAKLHPCRSLSALQDLHLSGLNPTHFLAALRYTYKSVRSFAKLMVKEMESAGWDLNAAAGAIQPDVLHCRKVAHRSFAFESYVCQKMFSDFQQESFNLSALEERTALDRRHFFEEFSKLKSSEQKQRPGHQPRHAPSTPAMAQFYRARYLALVHPKMESSFFGDLDQRAAVSSGRAWPDSPFFAEFAEMARRVWLLHCLFFSFEREPGCTVFQVRRGSRFSDVYMESVTEEGNAAGGGGDAEPVLSRPATVGFTVVPGFRVGRVVIQCKVYLSSHPVQ